jgi:hypothetical protein
MTSPKKLFANIDLFPNNKTAGRGDKTIRGSGVRLFGLTLRCITILRVNIFPD